MVALSAVIDPFDALDLAKVDLVGVEGTSRLEESLRFKRKGFWEKAE